MDSLYLLFNTYMRLPRSWGVCQEFWFITNPGYFQSLYLAKSCSNLKKIRPRAESGSYVIDPDGEGGLLPMYDVICDMTDKNGVGVAVISHDSENRTQVKGYETPGSYSRDIHYTGASLSQLASLIRVSIHCEQFIKYECYHSILLYRGYEYGWWVSLVMIRWRNGEGPLRMTNAHAG